MKTIYQQLERQRRPRVHIKYEVETEQGTEQRELPFVIGVMGDFSGNNPSKAKKPLPERKFVTINKDNFQQVMRAIAPGLKLEVENKLKNDGSYLTCQLQFKSMDDFTPESIIQQFEPLRQLSQARDILRELASRADRSPALEQQLEQLIQQDDKLLQLAKELALLPTTSS